MFKTIKLRSGNYTINAIKDDQHITTRLLLGDEWKDWMREDVKKYYKKGTDIVDIGANIGTNTLMFSDYGPVHSFEPAFHTILSKNIEQNTLKNPVKVYPFGISQEKKDFDFYLPKPSNGRTNYGGASINACPSCSTKFHRIIEVDKLDDVYYGKPSIIKIDVEGHELFTLYGCAETIRIHKPAIFIEIFNYTENHEIAKFLEKFGYAKPEVRPDSNYVFVNYRNEYHFSK